MTWIQEYEKNAHSEFSIFHFKFRRVLAQLQTRCILSLSASGRHAQSGPGTGNQMGRMISGQQEGGPQGRLNIHTDLGIQNFAYLVCQLLAREWFLKEKSACLQHAMRGNGIICIPGHEKYPGFRVQKRQFVG